MAKANKDAEDAPKGEIDLSGAPEAKAGKKKWLDKVYSFMGVHYGPSKYPGHHIDVPHDFPEDVGGEEPAPEDWRPLPESHVIPALPANTVL